MTAYRITAAVIGAAGALLAVGGTFITRFVRAMRDTDPHQNHQGEPMPDHDYDYDYDDDPLREDDTEEWQDGECDRCFGSTEEELKAAADSPGLMPVCACAIGQGASPEDCVCGPVDAEARR